LKENHGGTENTERHGGAGILDFLPKASLREIYDFKFEKEGTRAAYPHGWDGTVVHVEKFIPF
jgi:hypothetical protein